MSYKVVELSCPSCGAPLTEDMTECPYCGRKLVITKFESVNKMSDRDLSGLASQYTGELAANPTSPTLNNAAAFCYLKLKSYDKALSCFEKAISDNCTNPEGYFYAAVALLRGKRPFLAARSVVEKIEAYVNSATMLEEKGIYYYFLSYVKYDHHQRKLLKTKPDYRELYRKAVELGVKESEAEELFSLLGVDRPDVL